MFDKYVETVVEQTREVLSESMPMTVKEVIEYQNRLSNCCVKISDEIVKITSDVKTLNQWYSLENHDLKDLMNCTMQRINECWIKYHELIDEKSSGLQEYSN